MADNIQVQVELNKVRAERGLRDFAQQLSSADQLLNQLKKSGVVWASDLEKSVSRARDAISTLGTVTSHATDAMIKGNKAYANSFKNIRDQVKGVSSSIENLGRSFAVIRNASKLPITAGLRDDNEKRRQAHFAKLQQAYVREQESLRQLARSKETYNAATKRTTVAALNQSHSVNKLGASWRLFRQEVKETVSVANAFQATARGVTAAVTGLAAKMLELLKTAPNLSSEMLGFRNALALVTGDQAEASKLLNTAVGIARELKLSITAVTKEYSKFTNAATIAGLSIQQATKTFEDFAIAARVLNLTQERTSGMFLALEQMISKGRVSMEELRRQLGEHIPGALNLAATAMGYGKDELGKFIKQVASGNVVSTELVTKLGELVKKRTIPQLGSSLQKFSAAMQDLNNAFTIFQLKVGEVMANILVPMITNLAKVVDAMNEWLPATQVLGDETEKLGSQLDGVTTAAATINTSLNTLSDTQKVLADTTNLSKMTVDDFSESLQDMNIVAVGSIGLLGASGMGGIMIALKKAFGWVKGGLLAFLAPFGKMITWSSTAIKFMGKAGLAGTVALLSSKLKDLIQVMLKYKAVAFVITKLNPYTAIASGIVAAVTAAWAFIDVNDEIKDRLKAVSDSAEESKKKAGEMAGEYERLFILMTDLGEGNLAAALHAQEEMIQKARRTQALLKKQNDTLLDGVGFIHKQLANWNYTTDAMEEVYRKSANIEKSIAEIDRFIENIRSNSGDIELALQIEQEEESVKEALKWLDSTKEARELRFEISMVGATDLATTISEINYEMDELIDKANISNKGPAFEQERQRLEVIRQLKIELATMTYLEKQNTEAKKEASRAAKELTRDYDNFGKTLKDSINDLIKQNAQIGMTKEELAKSNAEFKIAALNEELYKLQLKDTNGAMAERITMMRSQIGTIEELYAKNRELAQIEGDRQAQLKRQNEETKKLIDLQKQGSELLKDTLSIEQKYRLQMEELRPALEAVGASQEQVRQVGQKVWRGLVEESNTSLKSIEAITEEVAQNMQRSFSDFFFDAMEGNFNNLADSFHKTIQRMVADAAAAQLTKYLFNSASNFGGGILGSIGTSIMTGLGAAGPAPAATGFGSGTFATGSGMFVNLHKGGIATEGIPRYHRGVGPREQPAILRKDEGVFTPGQMSSLASLEDIRAAGTSSGGGNTVTFAPQINIDASNAAPGVEQDIKGLVRRQMDESFAKFKGMGTGVNRSESQWGVQLAGAMQRGKRNM